MQDNIADLTEYLIRDPVIPELPHIDFHLRHMRAIKRAMMRTAAGNIAEEFLLRHGIARLGRELPRKYKQMPTGQCYSNAAMLARRYHGKLTYCEGFGYSGLIVAEHAWCLDSEGQVVDPTWQYRGPGAEYLGIPFDLKYATASLMHGGAVLWNWTKGWPVIMGKVQPEEYLAAQWQLENRTL